MKLVRLSLAEIVPPAHPVRAAWDEDKLVELAANIRKNGLIVPMAVKKVGNSYEVVNGHRRLLACRIAELAAVPCLLLTQEEAATEVFKVSENYGREELSPAEEGAYFAELMEMLGADVDKVCAHTGQNRSYVEGRLNLLTGDADVLKALVEKRIGLGVAQQLNKIRRDSDRAYCLHFAAKDGATVATVAAWVQSYNARPDSDVPPDLTTATASEPAAPAPNPMKCWICQSSEEPWDLRILYEHQSCRRVLDRQAAANMREQVQNAI